jgi:hypothetical protein
MNTITEFTIAAAIVAFLLGVVCQISIRARSKGYSVSDGHALSALEAIDP